MIATLRGKLLYSDTISVIIECSGVGFKCFVTNQTIHNLPKIGEEMMLYTYLSVREDALDLYGFSDIKELEAFKLIISVNGVGAKIGIAILSQFNSDRLFGYISTNDAKALTSASGVGIKLAQRIVLELKDKVGNLTSEDGEILRMGTTVDNSASSEAIEALIALGYSKGEASLAIGKIEGDLSSSELIKQALKILTRRL